MAQDVIVREEDCETDEGVTYELIKVEDKKRSKSTRLNSSHGSISYAVFCLKKKNT